MIDKGVILRNIFERNAVRRKAQLPLLDVRKELEAQIAIQIYDEYDDAWLAVLEEVRARLNEKWHRRRYRPGNSIEALARNHHVINVAKRILRMRTGIVEPIGCSPIDCKL